MNGEPKITEPTNRAGDSALVDVEVPPGEPENSAIAEVPGVDPAGNCNVVFAAADSNDEAAVDDGDCVVDPRTDSADIAEDFGAAELAESLTRLSDEVSRFHDRAAAQESLIAKMHARIEGLQSGETRKLLKPVSTQLIALYSDLEDAATSLRPDTSVEQFGGLLTGFALTVEQILDHLGLMSLGTAAGDDFVPQLHHAVKKVDTGDMASDRKIAAVLRQGFIEPGQAKPLMPSRVSVYRCEASASGATITADSGASS